MAREAMTPSQLSRRLRRIAARAESGGASAAGIRARLAETIEELDEGPEETVSVNVPKDVERYVKNVKDKNPGYTDAQAWATAWSIYCENKNPDSPHCEQGHYFD